MPGKTHLRDRGKTVTEVSQKIEVSRVQEEEFRIGENTDHQCQISTRHMMDFSLPTRTGDRSAFASGHLRSWKQKRGKSESNFFSEPVKNITKMEN